MAWNWKASNTGSLICILNRLVLTLSLIHISTACGATIEQALADQIIAAGMAAAGLIGIVTKDRKKEQENHDNG